MFFCSRRCRIAVLQWIRQLHSVSRRVLLRYTVGLTDRVFGRRVLCRRRVHVHALPCRVVLPGPSSRRGLEGAVSGGTVLPRWHELVLGVPEGLLLPGCLTRTDGVPGRILRRRREQDGMR